MSMPALKDSNAVSDGRREIESYLICERELANAQSDLRRAECSMTNSTNALGAWLCPKDAKPGEQFCIWHGGHLLVASLVSDRNYKVTIRERAKP